MNNMPRGLINFAESGVMTDGESVLINLYTAMDAEIETKNGKVKVCVMGEYLSDCKAKIKLTFDGNPMPVKLRVPAWSNEGTVTVDGVEYTVTPSYFTVVPTKSIVSIGVAFNDDVHVVEVVSDPERGDLEWKKGRWVSDGKNELKYHVADFASGTNLMTEDKHFFSIYF